MSSRYEISFLTCVAFYFWCPIIAKTIEFLLQEQILADWFQSSEDGLTTPDLQNCRTTFWNVPHAAWWTQTCPSFFWEQKNLCHWKISTCSELLESCSLVRRRLRMIQITCRRNNHRGFLHSKTFRQALRLLRCKARIICIFLHVFSKDNTAICMKFLPDAIAFHWIFFATKHMQFRRFPTGSDHGSQLSFVRIYTCAIRNCHAKQKAADDDVHVKILSHHKHMHCMLTVRFDFQCCWQEASQRVEKVREHSRDWQTLSATNQLCQLVLSSVSPLVEHLRYGRCVHRVQRNSAKLCFLEENEFLFWTFVAKQCDLAMNITFTCGVFKTLSKRREMLGNGTNLRTFDVDKVPLGWFEVSKLLFESAVAFFSDGCLSWKKTFRLTAVASCFEEHESSKFNQTKDGRGRIAEFRSSFRAIQPCAYCTHENNWQRAWPVALLARPRYVAQTLTTSGCRCSRHLDRECDHTLSNVPFCKKKKKKN